MPHISCISTHFFFMAREKQSHCSSKVQLFSCRFIRGGGVEKENYFSGIYFLTSKIVSYSREQMKKYQTQTDQKLEITILKRDQWETNIFSFNSVFPDILCQLFPTRDVFCNKLMYSRLLGFDHTQRMRLLKRWQNMFCQIKCDINTHWRQTLNIIFLIQAMNSMTKMDPSHRHLHQWIPLRHRPQWWGHSWRCYWRTIWMDC